jgi:DNA-binding response OmpR family regulator/signal transduction histidine kinase
MDFSTGRGADTSGNGWWAVESALSPSNVSQPNVNISARIIQEYSVLAGVAASMSSGFLLLNAMGRVTYFNASALRLLGVNKRELIEQPVFDVRKHLLSLAAEPRDVATELEQAWRSAEQESSAEIALAAAAVRWLRVRFFPMRDALGCLLGRGVLLDDITLERASGKARSETLAGAAHELKTPLAVIKGCATTLLGNSTRWDPALQREMLQMIDTHADRLYDILNTLLDVWRLDSGAQTLHLTQLQIPALLRQLLERWQSNAPRHTFALNMPPSVPVVVCDPLRIEQALQALLNNAVTYAPAGGVISIELESNDIEIRIAISDEGRGLAPEHLERIFDRFYRVQEEEEGTGGGEGSGLGLTIARATFDAHGGKIWADSPGPGRGSTFYCTLPFAPRAAPSAWEQAQAQASGPPSISSVRTTAPLKQDERSYVLVAESDPRLSRYLRANLEEHAYRVQTVSSGVQFLRQLDLEEPDIIVLSTQMPDTGGLELLQRMREFLQTPVIMLYADCEENERVRLFDLGADDLVAKPFGMKELLARVRARLRRQPAPVEQASGLAVFTSGDLTINYAQHLVLFQDRPVQLSRTEYKLLSALARNAGMVLTHEVLLERVWGPEYNREVDFIWVYISRLRRKIEPDPRHPCYILTVPEVGYKLAKL